MFVKYEVLAPFERCPGFDEKQCVKKYRWLLYQVHPHPIFIPKYFSDKMLFKNVTLPISKFISVSKLTNLTQCQKVSSYYDVILILSLFSFVFQYSVYCFYWYPWRNLDVI